MSARRGQWGHTELAAMGARLGGGHFSVVLSDSEANENLPTACVVPTTSWEDSASMPLGAIEAPAGAIGKKRSAVLLEFRPFPQNLIESTPHRTVPHALLSQISNRASSYFANMDCQNQHLWTITNRNAVEREAPVRGQVLHAFIPTDLGRNRATIPVRLKPYLVVSRTDVNARWPRHCCVVCPCEEVSAELASLREDEIPPFSVIPAVGTIEPTKIHLIVCSFPITIDYSYEYPVEMSGGNRFNQGSVGRIKAVQIFGPIVSCDVMDTVEEQIVSYLQLPLSHGSDHDSQG